MNADVLCNVAVSKTTEMSLSCLSNSDSLEHLSVTQFLYGRFHCVSPSIHQCLSLFSLPFSSEFVSCGLILISLAYQLLTTFFSQLSPTETTEVANGAARVSSQPHNSAVTHCVLSHPSS